MFVKQNLDRKRKKRGNFLQIFRIEKAFARLQAWGYAEQGFCDVTKTQYG